jgi:hypothetical protein
MFETTKNPICPICNVTVNVWSNELISNAWQKGGNNHFDYDCPDCDVMQSFHIPIDGEIENLPPGQVFTRWVLSKLK